MAQTLADDVLGQRGQFYESLVHRHLSLSDVRQKELAQTVGVEDAADLLGPTLATMLFLTQRLSFLHPSDNHPCQFAEDLQAVAGRVCQGVARESAALRVPFEELPNRNSPPDEVC